MPRRKQQKKPAIGEDTRIAVNLTIRKLLAAPEQKELEFPSSYTAEERAYIHDLAREHGLKSKSRGKGTNRFLTVYKREGSTIVQADAIIKLQKSSRQGIYNLIQKFPLSNKERQDLLPPTERERIINTEVNTNTKAMGRLNGGIPQVPQLKTNMDVLPFRECLPVYNMREEIMQVLPSSQVIIIAGETGSGKTTQVPQFILDYCQQRNQTCRIICTQPRRLSAVSVAERVAFERDEKIGQTFGYQIRLESRVSPKTLLTYCTNGVLLRTLMGGDSALATITHIIVDEIHERDRFCDFLLIALKDALVKFRSLKVVLMSATMDTSIFLKYFNHCSVINVPGRLYDVEVLYLEDILKVTNYMTKDMSAKKEKMVNKKDQKKVLESWTQYKPVNSTINYISERNLIPAPILGQQNQPVPERVELEPRLVDKMDRSISEAWLCGGEDNFTQLLYFIQSENVSVDYQHSKTSVTPLMVAAGRGCIDTTERLLNLGANLNIRSVNEWTALDWARKMNQVECAELIEAYMKTYDCETAYEDVPLDKNIPISEEDKMLLDVYHHTFNDENVDYDLMFSLILHIHTKMPYGSILVFLPGYDDIVTMRERINAEEKRMSERFRYNLFVLHSNMQTCDQKRVFRPSPQGTRKIILSTNIAETSITIDDVVYVIDSGKVKEKSFDAMSGVCTLRSNWISQACAKQRKGRAGRCQNGICFRLFSSVRFNSMQPYQTPEILRLPLQELCLYTKHLAPGNTPIAEFLDRALEPPSNAVTRNAVQLLKTIDALDPWEDLTELGSHLLDLPVEPRLGKMLLYAVVLKCLDPILTIVCSLAYKDPFLLPSQPSQKRAATLSRKDFSAGTYSDHMAVLRAFQSWQTARANGRERLFCEKNFISAATMEMVVGMRTQLLGQLRASGFVRARGSGDIRDLNSNSENWAVVKAALTAGLYPNLIRVDREHSQLRTQKEVKVVFHPSSTLRDNPKSPRTTSAQTHSANVNALPCDWLLYEEMSRSGRFCHVKTVTLVNPITVALFSGPARLPMDVIYEAETIPESESDSEADEAQEGTTILKLDDWVVFKLDPEAAQLILHLRQKWNALFLRRMKTPSKPMSQLDEQVVRTLVSVITNEEQACGLHQPSGIGQRPRPLIVDYYPASARRPDDYEERNF
ncbi:3'-5' RNA helicase YTHDC2 [Neodiprion pinetum]|uniref:3'-5' RNA helicase YTHDC2 n=1 Tax=Neodiprion lecontei TaxID=441921 RepID=A0A6J0C2R4_NEOLC|nr:3'-5' RNA helicase YTHDC2 [Neodiprion lecontei]XP_046483790.1 3'-5' RNA helicase YTHDC2-like isoform X1 [Neodiprion pinetum]XP_046483791.1 3'-5' RNA helicase YTHDC2-like isoform X1 [Neodiprion pinetum]XP_046598003.1 3'-5' RNA helicase YTHDC2 [Neodiprion lecontei]